MDNKAPVSVSFVSDFDNAKNEAYFILSDANQIKNKRVNVHQLAFAHDVDTESFNFSNSSNKGAISNGRNGIVLKASEKLTPLEENFEYAVLLSLMLSSNAKIELPKDRMYPHKFNTDNEEWLHAEDTAMFLLFYHVNKRELAALNHKKSDKLIAKIAHKKGLPTRLVLKRLALEI